MFVCFERGYNGAKGAHAAGVSAGGQKLATTGASARLCALRCLLFVIQKTTQKIFATMGEFIIVWTD